MTASGLLGVTGPGPSAGPFFGPGPNSGSLSGWLAWTTATAGTTLPPCSTSPTATRIVGSRVSVTVGPGRVGGAAVAVPGHGRTVGLAAVVGSGRVVPAGADPPAATTEPGPAAGRPPPSRCHRCRAMPAFSQKAASPGTTAGRTRGPTCAPGLAGGIGLGGGIGSAGGRSSFLSFSLSLPSGGGSPARFSASQWARMSTYAVPSYRPTPSCLLGRCGLGERTRAA